MVESDVLAQRLAGQSALIVGASGGIGAAVCRRFAKEGASLAIHYFQNRSAAERLQEELAREGAKTILLSADGRNEAQVRQAVQRAADELGGLSILVHCAGIARDALALQTSAERWTEIIETNLTSAFFFSRAAAKFMLRQKAGRIIFISSIAAQIPGPGQAAYAASKGGLEAHVRALAVELGPKRITVNAIAPGRILTHMTREVNAREQDGLLARIPLGRYGEPAEVAALAAFLASDDAAYITGQVITIDGGLSLGAKLLSPRTP